MNNNAPCNCSFMPFCKTKLSNNQTPDTLLATRTRHFVRNQALCVLNDKFQNIYIIKKGAVKAYQVDRNGNERIHAFYFAGETIGYRSIHAGHYISTVVALTSTVVCELSYDHLIDFLKTKPELYNYILALVSKQLGKMSFMDVASAEQRIAAMLIDLSIRAEGAIPMRELTLPMNRQDMGNYLGLTAETVSRILSRLQKNDIIEAERKFIRITNPQKLQQLAQ